MQPSKRAVSYCRVSTALQERDGVSLDAQLDMARRYCAERGWELVDTYCDVMSGRTSKRPDLERLQVDAAARKFDTVIVYKLDRLSRSAYHYYHLLAELGRAQVDIASLTQTFDTSTATGRFLLGALILLAQMEAEQTSERVADSVKHRARQGLHMPPRAPLGYRYIKAVTDEYGNKTPGRLEIDEDQRPIVEILFATYLETRSCGATAKRMNGLGYCTREGSPFDPGNIHKLLDNPIYCGDLAGCRFIVQRVGGEKKLRATKRTEWIVTRDTAPAIVSREDWEEAQKHLAANRDKSPRAISSVRVYPWSGLARCGSCGGPLVRLPQKDKDYYRCRNSVRKGGTACPAPGGVGVSFLEGQLLPLLFERVRQQATEGQARARKRTGPTKPTPIRVDRAKVLADIAAERERYVRAWGQRRIADDLYEKLMGELDDRAAALQEEPEAVPAGPAVPRFAENMIEAWGALPPAHQGDLLRLIIERLVVANKEIRVHWQRYADPTWPVEPLTVPIKYTRKRHT